MKVYGTLYDPILLTGNGEYERKENINDCLILYLAELFHSKHPDELGLTCYILTIQQMVVHVIN